MNPTGYNRLWRRWVESPMATDANAALLFLHILCNVRWESKTDRRYGYTVDKGEWAVTHKQLASLTGLPLKRARLALERLVRYGTVEVRRTTRRTCGVIRLRNYEAYQSNGQEDGRTQPDSNGLQTADKGRSLHNDPIMEQTGVKKTPRKKRVSTPETQDFINWYSQYPGIEPKRAEAWKHWQQMSEDDRAKALEVLPAYIQSKAGADIQFTVRAHNYLKERMFNNPIVTPKPKSLGGNPIGGADSW